MVAGEVVELEVLKGSVRVKHQDGKDFYFKRYSVSDIEVEEKKEDD